MNSIELVKRLNHHRAWVNRNLLAAADPLSSQQLEAQYEIGQGSIWKSLLHMYAAEYVWLEALLGNEDGLTPGDLPGRLPGNQQGDGAMGSLSELKQNWSALEQRWIDYLAALKPEALEDIVARKSASTGKRFTNRRSDVLLHVCTHAHYTAAQVVNMLRQTGVTTLPETMLVSLARQEPL